MSYQPNKFFDPINIFQPAAVPSGSEVEVFRNREKRAVYEIISIRTRVVTDANVATRVMAIQIQDVNGNEVFSTSSYTINATNTIQTVFTPDAHTQFSTTERDDGNLTQMKFITRHLYFGDRLMIQLASRQAGDTLSFYIRLRKLKQ